MPCYQSIGPRLKQRVSYSAIRFIRLQKRGEKETPPETGLSIRNRSFIDTLYARCTPKRWPEKTKCLESATYVEPKYWLPSPPEVENRPPSDDVKRSFEPTAIAAAPCVPRAPHADRNRTVLVDEGRATFVHERRRGQRDFQKRQERYVQIVIERVVVEGSRRQPVVEEIGSDADSAVGGHFRRRTVQQAGDTQRRLRRQFRCNGHTSEQDNRYGTPYDPFGPDHHAVETIGFVVGLRSFSISCFRRRPYRRRREPYACRRA